MKKRASFKLIITILLFVLILVRVSKLSFDFLSMSLILNIF